MEALRKPLPVLILAGLFAALATYFAYLHLSRTPGGRPVVRERVPVVVVNEDLRAGTVLQREMLGVEMHPDDRVPREAVRTPAAAIGLVASVPLAAGEVVQLTQLSEPSAALGPAYVLPSHMRAVTVSANLVSGIAGFLKAGDRVDVLATFTRSQEASTRTVLQDVEVMAVGLETEPASAEGESVSRNVSRAGSMNREVPVTLAVTTPEAERLVLADTRGKIRLALRPATGGSYSSTPGVTEAQLSGLRSAPSASSSRPPAPFRVVHTVPSGPAFSAAVPAAALRRPSPPVERAWPARSFSDRRDADGPEKPSYEITVIRGTAVEQVTLQPGSGPAARKRDSGPSGAADGHGDPQVRAKPVSEPALTISPTQE